MKKKNINKLTTLIRFIIGIILITILLWRLDIKEVFLKIGQLQFQYVMLGLLCYFFFIVVSAWRWQVLLDFKNFKMTFLKTASIYFIATFFNNFLPTTVGGDVMRVLYAEKHRRTDALATVLVDRILGFVGLFIFAFFAVIYLLIVQHQIEFLPIILAGLIMIIVITYLFFSESIYTRISPIVEKIRILKLGTRLNRLHSAATEFGGAWQVIIICVILSVIIQMLLALGPFIVMKGMTDLELGVLPFFIYIPIINVISMIPISFNALGVREYFYILLFSRVAVKGETAVAISLVSFFLYFLLSLIGGIIFIFLRRNNFNEENVDKRR